MLNDLATHTKKVFSLPPQSLGTKPVSSGLVQEWLTFTWGEQRSSTSRPVDVIYFIGFLFCMCYLLRKNKTEYKLLLYIPSIF